MKKLNTEEMMLIHGGQYACSTPTDMDCFNIGPIPVTGYSGPTDWWGNPIPYDPYASGGSSAPPPPPQPNCMPKLAPVDRMDRGYLHGLEGGLRTQLYTVGPASRFPYSGVTVGVGVDLGSKTLSQLTGWGLSSSGAAVLSPFLGLKGQAAINALSQAGAPSISMTDAENISNGAINDWRIHVGGKFTSNNSLGLDFEELPESVQTVLVSMAYLFGNLQDKTPTFFGHMTSFNFVAAHDELKNWGADEGIQSRLNALAAKITSAMAYNGLPATVATSVCN